MFFIIYGNESQVVDLGTRKDQLCGNCGEERPFRLSLEYQYMHVYFVLGMVKSREYVLSCEYCSEAVPIERGEARRMLLTDPIPVNHRYGCLWLLIAVVALVAALALAVVFGDLGTPSAPTRRYRR